MNRLKITLLICILALKSSFAQFEFSNTGARAIGLNGAFTSLSDNSLAIFYNPAGLGQISFREVSAYYGPSLYGISEISTAAITYTEPMEFGTFGLGLKTYGFDLYRESELILSYGNNYRNKIFWGINLNYYNLIIQNYNSANALGADIGGLAYLTEFLRWGFFAGNITGSTIGESRQKITQIYRTGFTIQPKSDLNMILEFEKDVKFPLSFRGGLEYFVNEYVDLRAGIGTQPDTFSGGISFNYNILQLDYSITNHQDLGMTNQFSVTANFGGSKARENIRNKLKNSFK